MAATIAKPQEDAFPCSLTIRIPFPTHRLADTALRALSVDPELSPLVQRKFSLARPSAAASTSADTNTNGNNTQPLQNEEEEDDVEQHTVLVTRYAATTNRMLRVAVNGFFESVGVVVACMRELDVEVVGSEWLGDGDEEVDGLRRVQGLQETGTIG